MKKLYKNTEFSEKGCESCGKPLKKNLLAKQPRARFCYRCWYPIKMRGGMANVSAS